MERDWWHPKKDYVIGKQKGRFLADISRREFLALSAASIMSGTLLDKDSVSKPATLPGKKPNILVIMTDQQNAGMMSCTGNPWVKTPNIDRIADEGVRFERAYCVNPVCMPSRFAMLAGINPSVVGIESNADVDKLISPEILHNTMGAIFRRAGYRTVYGGRVHMPGQQGVKNNIRAYGFDLITPEGSEGRDELVAASEQFFKQKHDQPFLMVASFMNPHDICYMAINAYCRQTGEKILPGVHQECLNDAMKMPEGISEKEFFDKYCPPLPANHGIQENEPDGLAALDWRPFRAYVRQNWTEKDWRLHRWAYARLTERVDAEIGRVLDGLERAGLMEDTVIVFTSDHGDMDAAHRMEHKTVPYEEAINIPFIVSWKGVTKAGTVDREHLVSSGLDLIPTISDFAGIKVPSEFIGRSVRKLAEGSIVKDWRSSMVIEDENLRMLHMRDKKYAVYATGNRREQFVDMEKDPGEMRNVAYEPAYKSQVERGRRLLKEWYAAHNMNLDPKYIIEK